MGKDVETVERMIAAPAEKIFALLGDASRHREFDGSGTVRDVAAGTPKKLSLGDTFAMDMHLGLPYSMINTVVEYSENRVIAWQPRANYPLIGRLVGGRIWRYELDPVAGGTLVRESWDIRQELLKPLVAPARGKTRKAMAASLERLDRLVTAGPA